MTLDPITPTCPDCGSSDLQALTVVVVLARDPVALYRHGDRVYVDVQEGGLGPAEPLDSDRDGTRYVCGDCGREGDPEEWAEPCEHPDTEDGRCLNCGEWVAPYDD